MYLYPCDNAVVIQPDTTQPVTLRVKQSVLEYSKTGGKGYQTRINAVLESYVETQQNKQHQKDI
ncbi:MAG: BrnA antitoxin family protein [Cyanobacteria bacterium P01_C01_bin.72]